MSDDPTGLILSAIAGLRTDMQADMVALRADMEAGMAGLRADMRADVAGLRAEFTALRTNPLAQSERVLNEVSALRDDMTVVMARLDRMDATVHGCVTEVRALHRQISRIAARVTELEQR